MNALIKFIGTLLLLITLTEVSAQTAQEFIDSGRIRSGLGNFNGAIDDYNKAIALSPDNSSYYISRGTVKYKMGDYSGSSKDYQNAIDLEPDHWGIYSLLGYSKYSLGDYIGAIEAYNKTLADNPLDESVLAWRADAKKIC